MTSFKLEKLFTIDKIGAASGLLLIDNELYIIADNSSYLYKYQIDTAILEKIKLHKNSQENCSKKEKLDFESITKKGNKLHIFGSGSTKNRNLKFSYDLETKTIKKKNLTKKYNSFAETISIETTELNIEGVFYNANKWYFFQRGNGEMAQNGVFIIDENKNIEFKKIELPTVQNVEASFTDAIFVNNKIYFLAAAENSNSTYNDGEIFGSFIGCMTIDFEIIFIQKISDTQKFEGLTTYNQIDNEINFLLCEDNDSEELKADIYQLSLIC
jgi:hypothetical protein